MLAISCESKEEVNRLADTAGANGGIADPNPVQDHGFMFSRSFADPDGHIWEVAWMDPAVASGAQHVPAVEASRSEERRGGKECVSTGRSRWAPDHKKKKN